jgi:hypothetical protein
VRPRGVLPALLIAACAAALWGAPCRADDGADAKQPAGGAADSAGWPREYRGDGGALVVHQPQVDAWKDYASLEIRAAVELTPKGEEKPLLGALTLRSDTTTDFDARTVVLYGLNVTEVRFPALEDAGLAVERRELVAQLLPQGPLAVSLDRILAAVERSQLVKTHTAVGNAPPPIHVRSGEAVLLQILGKPILEPIEGTRLSYVVNTNWDLVQHDGRWYLRHGDGWVAHERLASARWLPAGELPADLSRLPAGEGWADVRAHVPGESIPGVEVIHTDRPAELIVTDGAPKLRGIPGTDLLYVENTESDLFQVRGAARVYLLLSGRWFLAPSFDGPWAPRSDPLPASFAAIPADHPKADVLASVPGTPEAEEAVIMASIPRTATVQRNATLTVHYDGEPRFAPIAGTEVEVATNTPFDVFKTTGGYYACHQAVWFQGPSARGPWLVATSVPAAIYAIPPPHPKHHVTYVVIYEVTPTTVVVGYTAGYAGAYVSEDDVLVWGTGHSWSYYEGCGYYSYPYHHAHWTYGAHVYYSHHHGVCMRGSGLYGPYGGVGRAAWYNPSTGTYGRAAAAYGPYRSTWAGYAYNPYTGTAAWSRKSATPYAQWGRSVVRHDDAWARGAHYTDARGTAVKVKGSDGGAAAGYRTRDGRSGGIARSGSGDLYVGKDGELYRRLDGGGWEKRSGDGWEPAEPVTPDAAAKAGAKERRRDAARERRQERAERDRLRRERERRERLEREARARRRGAERARRYEDQRRSRPSSYDYRRTRRYGGVRRGGGRRR